MPGGNLISFTTAPTPTTTWAPGLDNTTATFCVIPQGAKGCIITIETAPVRWRADGTDPTTSIGHYIANSGSLTLDSWTAPGTNWKSVMRKIKFCGTSATAALHVSFFD